MINDLPESATPFNPLLVHVPRQTSFHVPPGFYSATIRSLKVQHRQAKNSSVPILRIMFNVSVPGAGVDYLAKSDLKLDLNEGSDLWNVLCRFLGREHLSSFSGKQLNLESLVGLACDLRISHHSDKAREHAFPLVIVTDIQPAGTLIKPEARLKEQANS